MKQQPQELVNGIGGVFFKVRDPAIMAEWYERNLGMKIRNGHSDFLWRDKDHPDQVGRTVWAMFPANSDYFGNSKAQLMINYRVSNLDEMLQKLRERGINVEKVEEYPYGSFAWITDPEGNRIELWQPKGE